MPAPLIELLCCLLDAGFAVGGAGAAIPVTKNPATKLGQTKPTQRQSNQLINCALEGCDALSFRTTDYCWKHQDHRQSEPEPDQEYNWWEEKME